MSPRRAPMQISLQCRARFCSPVVDPFETGNPPYSKIQLPLTRFSSIYHLRSLVYVGNSVVFDLGIGLSMTDWLRMV